VINMNDVNELIKNIYEYIGEPVDYAELIGSPVPSTYGICYTYEDPGDILLAQAAKTLDELSNNLNVCAKWEPGNGYMDYSLDCDIPTYRCSNCKCEEELTTDYCPNCGAKMDLGDELL